jgi:hypothetical protein
MRGEQGARGAGREGLAAAVATLPKPVEPEDASIGDRNARSAGGAPSGSNALRDKSLSGIDKS